MKLVFALCTSALVVAGSISRVAAHGSEPHPTCKKGYSFDDNHRCVKKPA